MAWLDIVYLKISTCRPKVKDSCTCVVAEIAREGYLRRRQAGNFKSQGPNDWDSRKVRIVDSIPYEVINAPVRLAISDLNLPNGIESCIWGKQVPITEVAGYINDLPCILLGEGTAEAG